MAYNTSSILSSYQKDGKQFADVYKYEDDVTTIEFYTATGEYIIDGYAEELSNIDWDDFDSGKLDKYILDEYQATPITPNNPLAQ